MPARDEAENLTRLLPSLAGSGVEVVVVDDHSADATADVAAAAGARVVAAPTLPDGWTGKSWACATGAAAASEAERLLFLDADTTLEPRGLDRILGEHDRRGGMVSVQPVHVVERPYERLSAWFNLVALMGVDAFSPLRGRVRPTGAFGPCIVVDRNLYDRVGGHAAVRGDVLDDVALARAVTTAGGAVTLFGGEGVIRFRMYPRGLGQLVEGWTKNFAGGAAGTRPITLLLVVVWTAGAIAAAVAPLTAGRAGVVLYGAYAAQLAVLFRRVGRFGVATAVLFPIPLAFFLAVFLRSIVLTFGRREVAWRGRRIRT